MSHSSRYLLGEREAGILLWLARYRLTAVQLAKLLGYAPSSLELVQRHLRRLASVGLVARDRMQNSAGVGSAKFLYALSARGWRLLRTRSLVPEERFRQPKHSWWFELHATHTTDVLVSAHCLPRFEPRVSLDQVQTETELKRLSLRVSVTDAKSGIVRRRSLCPDAFLRFSHIAGDRRIETLIWVEVDMATEERHRWQEKLATLLAFLASDYPAHFGPFFPTVAVVVPSAGRRDQLKRWTEEFFEAEQLGKWARLFCFTAAAPETTAPLRFWTAPLWLQPFTEDATPLLDIDSGRIRTVRHNKPLRIT